MKGLRLFAVLFTAAFVVRVAIAWIAGYFFELNRTEMMCIAINLVDSGEYANPYGSHLTGPTAHSTPPFPLLLAAIIAVFRQPALAQAVIVTLACLVSAVRCALVPLFALDAGLSRLAAILAGAIGVLYIGALETEVRGSLDGPYAALALLGIVWMSLRIWRGNSWQHRIPWNFFALCGFSVLLNPSVLPVIIGLLALGFVACAKECRKRFLVRSIQLSAVIFAFLLPWGIRNAQKLDAFILTRSNLGLELWLSNGPDRTFDLSSNYSRYHPFNNLEEANMVAQLGEPLYNHEKMAEALDWIGSDPGAFARLTARRIFAWWFPPGKPALVAAKALLTLLAFAGLCMLRGGHRLLFSLIAVTWLTFPDLYYVIQWTSRMRYPMDWQLVLCAAAALAGLRDSTLRRLESKPAVLD